MSIPINNWNINPNPVPKEPEPIIKTVEKIVEKRIYVPLTAGIIKHRKDISYEAWEDKLKIVFKDEELGELKVEMSQKVARRFAKRILKLCPKPEN